MAGIFMEWVLCAAGGFAVGFACYRLWVRFSWSGKRVQRSINKSVIESGAEIRCPLHGTFPLADGVETDHGEVCPICYRKFVEIPTFTIGPKDDIKNP